MAGATLLAFSNGATDIITVLAATGATSSDNLAVASLFGASSFAITVILSGCITARPERKIFNLSRGNLPRDIGYFAFSTGLFILLGFLNLTYGVVGLTLLLVYSGYVFIVYFNEKKKNKYLEEGEGPEPKFNEDILDGDVERVEGNPSLGTNENDDVVIVEDAVSNEMIMGNDEDKKSGGNIAKGGFLDVPEPGEDRPRSRSAISQALSFSDNPTAGWENLSKKKISDKKNPNDGLDNDLNKELNIETDPDSYSLENNQNNQNKHSKRKHSSFIEEDLVKKKY